MKNRETLAGRAFFYELWPLMQSEINASTEDQDAPIPLVHKVLTSGNLDGSLTGIPEILLGGRDAAYLNAEDHILQWGGMPALLPLGEDDRWKRLKDLYLPRAGSFGSCQAG